MEQAGVFKNALSHVQIKYVRFNNLLKEESGVDFKSVLYDCREISF